MNAKPRVTIAALLATTLAAGALTAEEASEKDPGAESGKIDFIVLDKNVDGSLSAEEVSVIAGLETEFAKLDADGDQLLSRAEYKRWSRAGDVQQAKPDDPSTRPSGSSGAQHMPGSDAVE